MLPISPEVGSSEAVSTSDRAAAAAEVLSASQGIGDDRPAVWLSENGGAL